MSAALTPRARRWLIRGAVVSLFLAAVAWLLLRDDSTADDSDLLALVPQPERAALEDSVVAALSEIERGIPESGRMTGNVWPGLLERFFTGPGPRDRDPAKWPWPERVHDLRTFYETEGGPLDLVPDALERPNLGPLDQFPEDDGTSVRVLVGIALHLESRAYCDTVRGDKSAASRDIELILRLGDRVAMEADRDYTNALVAHTLVSIAIPWLSALGDEGVLDPGVEARTLVRTPLFEDLPSILGPSLAAEYLGMKTWIEEKGIVPLLQGRDVPHWLLPRVFFKKNRTIAGLAQACRDAIAELDRIPGERRSRVEPGSARSDGTRNAVLRFNSGEIILADYRENLSASFEPFDELRLEENALRLLLALRRYERLHGTLPPDLGALLAAVPELGSLPRDPYSGEPLRYDPARRIFWSVGIDGVDDGAPGWELMVRTGIRPRSKHPLDVVWWVPAAPQPASR